MHDVDRRAPRFEQLGDRLVRRREPIVVVEGHRAVACLHQRRGRAVQRGQARLEEARVAERRAHQEVARLRHREQRDLPCRAAVSVRIVVELVHHDVVDVGELPVAECHLGEDLGGRADDGGVGVHGCVSGHQPDVARAERLTEREELLVHQRLDGRRVERDLVLGEPLEVHRQRDERLPRTGRRREDDVAPREDLQDRLFLRRIELHPDLLRVSEEALEESVGSRRSAQRGG